MWGALDSWVPLIGGNAKDSWVPPVLPALPTERDKDRALEGAEFEECSPVPHPHNDTPALAALLALARPLGGAEGALAATALQRGK